jgi:hypothetical protein
MKENKREGSMVTTVITALIFFLILALFGKSVQAAELPPRKSVENALIYYHHNNCAPAKTTLASWQASTNIPETHSPA